ncbi:MAG: cation:proton antiporter [Myxococcales bacterium]|nr:cation:proton antiporter [Myxococcales bacterium]
MNHTLDLLWTLAGGLGVALVLGVAAQRVRLSPIVGYLVAGVAVGPFTPGFVAHAEIASQLSELGVILLMFGVGLQFHLEELLAVRRVAVPGALVQITVSTLAAALFVKLMGWPLGASVVFGLCLAVASTVVAIRVLSDANVLQTPAGHASIGWLVIEDIVAVLVLVLMPVLGRQGPPESLAATALTVGLALVKVAALVAFTLVVGRRFIPAALRYVARLRSRELFTLSVLVIALGIAVGSAHFFGVSMALGAFLAGMVVGQSEFAGRAAAEALPMRDAFAVLFFVAMGMLFNPRELFNNLPLIAGSLVVVWGVTPTVARFMARRMGASAATAAMLGAAMAQIGEFSFIVASLGRQLHLLPAQAMQTLVAVSMVTITASPFVFRWAAPKASQTPSSEPVGSLHRTIVVGFGPVGRTVTAMLRENAIAPVVIEMNPTTLALARSAGVETVEGNASEAAVLEAAGVGEATGLIFAASGSPEAVIRQALAMNPRLLMLARTNYLGEVHRLKEAGAHSVVAAEGEVALAMVETVMQRLGATADQLDRARDRVREGLLGPGA